MQRCHTHARRNGPPGQRWWPRRDFRWRHPPLNSRRYTTDAATTQCFSTVHWIYFLSFYPLIFLSVLQSFFPHFLLSFILFLFFFSVFLLSFCLLFFILFFLNARRFRLFCQVNKVLQDLTNTFARRPTERRNKSSKGGGGGKGRGT